MSDFNPIKIMLDELSAADKKRVRIMAWQLNDAALVKLHYVDGYNYVYSDNANKPIIERKFMGIPLKFMPEWEPHEVPRLEPEYEHIGRYNYRKLVVHDYNGPIHHGPLPPLPPPSEK